MRQFKAADTSKWNDGFGDYSAGDLTISSPVAMSAVSGCYYRLLTATINQYTGNLNSVIPAGTYIVKVVQVQQSTVADNWEYNILVSDGVSTSPTFKYKFQHNYTNAMLITSYMWDAIHINSTLTVDDWNGSLYGIGFLAGRSIDGSSGIITADGAGFRGGTGVKSSTSYAFAYNGEGYKSASSISSRSANGNGAGSSQNGSNVLHGSGGSGGSNGSAGTEGENFTDAGYPGEAGGVISDSSAEFFTLGGGGGGGCSKQDSSNVVYDGTRGGGAFDFLIKNADFSGIDFYSRGDNGGNGGANNDFLGGTGAGGLFTGRFEDLDIGTDKFNTKGGVAGDKSGARCNGGTGGKGRLSFLYSKSVAGSLDSQYYGAYYAAQDYTVIEPAKGGFIIPFMI